ncbi:hypothetical protein FRC96_08170 [Lujinxingia vulgaris]|uniref:Bacterial Ig-like domain-containing protein n=1 Tax=Lujinxingia vulgaris TaxID=2600176 RepID=A0A5C6XEY3_9DELT|nr:Ig-like domain-containing protein [Lujinxingia vulgaris]TXD37925.1 hypothetical protein FRC96_08170 [Lujinxingia vulgaris]
MTMNEGLKRQGLHAAVAALLVLAAGCVSELEQHAGPDAGHDSGDHTEVPGVEIVTGPEATTTERSARLEMACVGDAECEIECALDEARFEPCEAVVTYEDLEVGDHLFEARAVDASGRRSAIAAWAWTVANGEQAAPTLTIQGPPTLAADAQSATLTFAFSEEVSGFEVGDIAVDPAEHTLEDFSSVDASTYQATLRRSGNEEGTVIISVAAGAYQSAAGEAGRAASVTIVLEGEEVVSETCDETPHVAMSTIEAVTAFGTDTALIEFRMPPLPTVLSHPFTTGEDAFVSGQVDLGGASETSLHMRRMWISTCPGGEAIGQRCEAEGNLLTMRWAQGESRVACELQPDTTYYFNLSQGTGSPCERSDGCRAIIQHRG